MVATITNITIAAGQMLSGPLDLTGTTKSIAMIIFPAAWSANPPLTFQASLDGVTYYDVYTTEGPLLAVVRVVPGGCTLPALDKWRALFFKFRSGMPPLGSIQHAARTFGVVLT
jgi:hypothetical protein